MEHALNLITIVKIIREYMNIFVCSKLCTRVSNL
jgi:hypothetical protein